MPPIQQQSSRGKSAGSEHRELIFRGSASSTNSLQIHPPLHLCLCIRNGLSRTKSPSIRRFLSTILYKKWCIYERHCGFFMTHRQYDMTFQMWNQFLCYHRVRSGTRGSEIAAAFSIYLFHLSGRTQKSDMLWNGYSQASKRLLSLLQTQIKCVDEREWWCNAHSRVFFDSFWHWCSCILKLFMSSPCRWDSGDCVEEKSAKFSQCRDYRLRR